MFGVPKVSHADLCSLDGLTAAVADADPRYVGAGIGTFDGTFCPGCNDVRRMELGALFWEEHWTSSSVLLERESLPMPALFLVACVQCDSMILLVVFTGPGGLELVALPSTYGGLATPSTPDPVAFYLDQAQRSQSVGALSAAVTMYRSALEHLLEEQGYEARMLGPKIAALTNDGAPPAWRDALDPDYLRVIKDLGNASAHTNGGDISKQLVFEANLVREVQALFSELLDTIYEQPERKKARLGKLKQAASSFTE